MSHITVTLEDWQWDFVVDAVRAQAKRNKYPESYTAKSDRQIADAIKTQVTDAAAAEIAFDRRIEAAIKTQAADAAKEITA